MGFISLPLFLLRGTLKVMIQLFFFLVKQLFKLNCLPFLFMRMCVYLCASVCIYIPAVHRVQRGSWRVHSGCLPPDVGAQN